MVEPHRLIPPQDGFRDAFPSRDFRDVYHFHTQGEAVFITDPIYLADVYNEDDEVASFLRARGVFVMDFGGDTSCPVWWKPPYVVLPISLHQFEDLAEDEEMEMPEGVTLLADEVGTDSGSFIFLPLTSDLPPAVEGAVDKVLSKHNGAALPLPAGDWAVWYEQFEAPQTNMVGLYRNVVVRHEAPVV